ncbi:uncharacterized protein LOC129314468 [Prosopis cineraria]|uniref:uncharacterized protein LOC129314468 n=1 Tax=Prosopis cineraria TaxID=364024 RepID=UPI00240FDFB0|nr:uncharacterized protein LOC129314468 [Prosopis cineraria]
MYRKSERFPATRRISDEMYNNDDLAMSFSDTVFAFWEDLKSSSENSSNSGVSLGEEEEDENFSTLQQSKPFWDEQDQLLKATLCRTTSTESKIRQVTKEALEELNESSGMQMQCACRRPAMAYGCRSCLRREICSRLQNQGFNCAVCQSKWKSSSEIPSGEHTYLEVTEKSRSKSGEVIRVVIELNFRAEFEMARASEDYNRLISRLPEVFVGKVERLRVLIKILCSAAKKCMKEKRMHLAPWRKHKYMEAKWLVGTFDRSSAVALSVAGDHVVRPPKPKTSMLTCDLLENIPGLHRSVVEVL